MTYRQKATLSTSKERGAKVNASRQVMSALRCRASMTIHKGSSPREADAYSGQRRTLRAVMRLLMNVQA